jgi:intracellular septation protein A
VAALAVDRLGENALAITGVSPALAPHLREEARSQATWLGLLTATLFLGDGLLRRGRYFGRRLARYLLQPVSERRLAIGMGLLGATLALLNWGVARAFSTDVWLAYTTFGDIGVSMVLFFAVLRFARLRPGSGPSAH